MNTTKQVFKSEIFIRNNIKKINVLGYKNNKMLYINSLLSDKNLKYYILDCIVLNINMNNF